MKDKYHVFLESDGVESAEVYLIRGSTCHFAWHSAIEILTVLKGGTELYVEGQKHFLNEGAIFLINENVCHSIISQDRDNIIIVLKVSKNFLQKNYPTLYSNITMGLMSGTNDDAAFSEKIRLYLAEIVTHAMSGETIDNIIAKDYLSLLVSEIIKKTLGDTGGVAEFRNVRSPQALNKAIDYMEQNYASKLSLNVVADHVGYNPSYLSTAFKHYTGISFSEYLNRVRLRKALSMISDKTIGIEEVAERVGFACSGCMSKVSKKYCGKTPQEFRKTLANNKEAQFQNGEEKYISYPDADVEAILSNLLNPSRSLKERIGKAKAEDMRIEALRYCELVHNILENIGNLQSRT